MFKQKCTEEIIDLCDNSELEEAAEAINETIENAFKNLQSNIPHIDQESLNVNTDYFAVNIKNDEININAKKNDNHTLKDLEQKLINDLYIKDSYGLADIEIMKLIFENKKEN